MNDADGLEIIDLTVAYGGNVAVSGVSLRAPRGGITGLIGPNGAGKTSTFNACSGLLRARRGIVRLFGTDVTAKSPAVRARLGLGRTFQRVEVCHAMTVRNNIKVGCEARAAGLSPLRQLIAASREERAIDVAVGDAIERCGLGAIAESPLAALSTGQRRLVELARVLAGGFQLLLLDEPSSGLDEAETQRFGTVLVRAVADLGVGILLVEHDMDLVMGVCDHVHVLDFGQLVFDGTPSDTRSSPIVRAAYLGADEPELVP
jgi:ABC-type branched-subunit amino acid transport system ATPase component